MVSAISFGQQMTSREMSALGGQSVNGTQLIVNLGDFVINEDISGPQLYNGFIYTIREYDTVSPTIISTSVNSSNTLLTVSFNEAVFSSYSSNTATGTLDAQDFIFSLDGGTATLSSTTPTSVSVSGTVYALGLALNGFTSGQETVTVNLQPNAVYDAAGNVANSAQTSNTAQLNPCTSKPTVSLSSNTSSNTLCSDYDSIAFTAQTNAQSPTYVFLINGVEYQNGPSATYSHTSASTYTLTHGDVVSVRVDTPSGCSSTASVSIVVNSISTASSITASQTLGSIGALPNALQGSAAVSSGTISYQWQLSTDGGSTYTDISSATSQNLSFSSGLTTDTYYRRVTSSSLNGVLCEVISNAVLIRVTQIPDTVCSYAISSLGGQYSNNDTLILNLGGPVINENTNGVSLYNGFIYTIRPRPAIVSSTLNATNTEIQIEFNEAVFASSSSGQATGSLEVSDFEYSITGGTATLSSTTPTSISQNGKVFTLGIALNDPITGEETITIDLPANAVFNSGSVVASENQRNNQVQPNPCVVPPTLTLSSTLDQNTACGDELVTLTASSNAAQASYTFSINGVDYASSSGTLQISATTLVSGSGQVTLTVESVYGCTQVVTAVYVQNIISTVGTVTGAQTVSAAGMIPNTLQGTVASAAGTISYQWQFSSDDINFSDLSGATNQNYVFPSGINGNTYYRRVTTSTFNGLSCSEVSNSVLVELNQVPGGISNFEISAFGGERGSGPCAIINLGGTVINEQLSSTQGYQGFIYTIRPLPYISSTSINASNTQIQVNFNEAVFTNFSSNTATGTLMPDDFELSITGGSATLSSTAPIQVNGSGTQFTLDISLIGYVSGSETITVNLKDSQVLDSGGNPLNAQQSNNEVRTNSCVSTPTLTLTDNTFNQAFCGYSSVNITANSDVPNATYTFFVNGIQMQQSSSTIFNMSDVATATTATHTIAVEVLSPAGCTHTQSITVIGNVIIDPGTLAAGYTISSINQAPAELSGTAAQAQGSVSYQWQQSVNGQTFTSIPGATAQNYTPGNLTQTTYFRRNTISSQGGSFCAAISNIITVTYDLDTDAPNLISTANPCSADRTFILNFDEKVFTSNNGTGDVSTSNFRFALSSGTAVLNSTSPIGISTELTEDGYSVRLEANLAGYATRNQILIVTLLSVLYDANGNRIPSSDMIQYIFLCVDSDQDGIPDTEDDCPNTPSGETVDENGCSLSQIDTDGDGVSDADDLCPDTQQGRTVNDEGCSLYQIDTDGDGINDAEDNCVETANADQADNDGDGTGNACDPDPVITTLISEIGEDAAVGTFVGLINAFDIDNLPVNVNISNTEGLFTLEGDNIILSGALDYETQTEHVIYITATSERGTSTTSVTVPVSDIPNTTYTGYFFITVFDVMNESLDAKVDYSRYFHPLNKGVGKWKIRKRISGGPDAHLFIIREPESSGPVGGEKNSDPEAEGFLDFITPPDFENPRDHNRDNIYEVIVTYENMDDGAAEVPIPVTQYQLQVPEGRPRVIELQSRLANPTEDTDADGIVDVVDNSPLVFNPAQTDEDGDGIGDVSDDFDHDGVWNPYDNCPDTPLGELVDENGCILVSFPVENFRVSKIEKCGDNHSIEVNVQGWNTYDFILSIQGPQTIISQPIESRRYKLTELSAGVYNICITVNGIPASEFERCFQVTLNDPAGLDVLSQYNVGDEIVYFQLKGGTQYTIVHNGKSIQTDQSNYALKLSKGVNNVRITNGIECQGVFEQQYINSYDIAVAPNPFQDQIQLFVGGNDTEALVEIYTTDGKQIFGQVYALSPVQRTIQINTTAFKQASYYIKVKAQTVDQSLFIIKE